MTSEYKILIYSTAGAKLAEVTDYLDLSVIKTVNAPGRIDFVLNGAHAAIALLADRAPVCVLRKNSALGLSWTVEAWGLYRAQDRTFADRYTFRATCPGLQSMLAWRHVLYYAGTANRSDFANVPAETIAKTLVAYNLGAPALTANGRIVSAALTGLSIETDAGRGEYLDKGVAWQNLLTALQDIASVGGGDFDLVAVTPNTWQFNWYAGQLGSDRTATVVFAVERSNMANPHYVDDKSREATFAVAGGPGTGSARSIQTAQSAAYSSGYHIETFVNASQLTTADGLTDAATLALWQQRAIKTFDFEVLQVPATAYGVHYFLGDRVTAKFQEIVATRKIVEVQLAFQPGGTEAIAVTTVDVV